ncbi:MAG: hypothetical protein VX346_19385 [Planctomycetota bacterium]|nr:hypothetical protein [Planctomycetota bacterium]
MGYFEAGGSLGRLVARRYFYSAEERGYRLGILREFSESFRRVNRLICVDTYTNYHFPKPTDTCPERIALFQQTCWTP